MAAPKPKKRKRKGTRTTDPAQSARFLEMAKKLEVDESGKAFEPALGAVIPPRKKQPSDRSKLTSKARIVGHKDSLGDASRDRRRSRPSVKGWTSDSLGTA